MTSDNVSAMNSRSRNNSSSSSSSAHSATLFMCVYIIVWLYLLISFMCVKIKFILKIKILTLMIITGVKIFSNIIQLNLIKLWVKLALHGYCYTVGVSVKLAAHTE